MQSNLGLKERATKKQTSLHVEIHSSSHGNQLVLELKSGELLMIQHFTLLPVVKAEMEDDSVSEHDGSYIEHQVGHIAVAVSVEGIVTDLITVWLVVSVGLVDDQVGVGVWGEYVLVAVDEGRISKEPD